MKYMYVNSNLLLLQWIIHQSFLYYVTYRESQGIFLQIDAIFLSLNNKNKMHRFSQFL